jgi:hypothetical protein
MMQEPCGGIHEVFDAAREGAAERPGHAPELTASWHFSRGCCPHCGLESVAGADWSSFSPRAAITTGSGLHPISEVAPTVPARLRALPMIYLLTSLLILTRGLRVPKTWRQVALVVGALVLLSCATLSVLFLRHLEPMRWLGQGWEQGEAPPLLLLSFDGLVLLLLAAGSAFGAWASSRLRRQVTEARQLDKYHLRQPIGAGAMGVVCRPGARSTCCARSAAPCAKPTPWA